MKKSSEAYTGGEFFNNSLFNMSHSKMGVRRIVSGLLLAIFLIQPASVVFAEETAPTESVDTQTTQETSSESMSDTNGLAPTNIESGESNDIEESIDPESENGESQSSAMMSEDPASASAKNTGIANDSLTNSSVSNTDGSLNYAYAITIPPGRNGLQPDLALTHNSGNSDDSDIFGYGWSINIPYIQHINKDGIENIFTNNHFYSSLSGELVQIGSTTEYRSKNEMGDFLKYVFSNNIWTVTDKTGKIYKFGSTTASRQNNSASTTQIFKWMVDEVRDTNNNYIRYDYYKATGQIYPYVITYTGSGSTDGIFTINFSREYISYNPTRYDTGFAASTTYRINEIRADINGQWSRKYSLAYTDADNGAREVLNTITESGRDEVSSSTVTLPSTTFNYQTTMSDGWGAEDASWVLPEGIVERDTGQDAGTRFGDINGDGYLDIIRWYSRPTVGGVAQMYFHNTVNGWVQNSYFDWSAAPLPFAKYSSGGPSHKNRMNDIGSRILDVNGDGLDDLVVGHYNDNSADIKKVYINTGTAWVWESSWVLPDYITGYEGELTSYDNGIRFGDVNGDGLPDLVHSYLDNGGNLLGGVYINTGTNWVLNSNWTAPEPFTYCFQCNSRGTDLGTVLIDINGDGLSDFVRGFYDTEGSHPLSKFAVYLNTGSGWASTSWSGIPSLMSWDIDYGMRFGDVNGDNLVDIVQSETEGTNVHDLHINTGTGWTTAIGIAPPSDAPFTTDDGDIGFRLLDINGDSIVDFVRSDTQEMLVSGGTTIRSDVRISNRKTADLISQITDPKGGQVGVVYKSSAQYKDSSSSTIALNKDLPFIIQTVATTTYDSGQGNTWLKTYKYSDADFYYASSSLRDRKFAGFGKIEEISESGKKISYQHQGNGNNSTTSESGDSYSKIGLTYRSEIQDLSDHIYTLVRNVWGGTDLGNNATFTKMTDSVVLQYDGDSDHKDIATSYVYNDTNGNLSAQTEWGEVSASTTGTYSDSGNDKRTTSFAYATNTSAYIVGLPSLQRLDDKAGIKVKESRFYYDTLSLGSTTKGNLTKKEDWATSTTYINTQSTYNGYGLKTQDLDPRSNATNYVYDSYNLYPATTTNALSQSTKYTYDYSSGKAKSVTDPNTFIHEQVYDGLDRVTEAKEPRSSDGSRITVETNTYTDTSGAVKFQNTKYLNSATTTDSHIYFDGFGRKVQERQEAEISNQFSVRDTVYGGEGRLNRESLPYFDTGSSKTNPVATNALYITYAYDPLNRKIGIGTVLGTTTVGYDQWNEIATDTLSHSKTYGYDAYNRLGSVIERNGTSTFTTTYDWTVHDQLGTTTDALSNIRKFTYDGLGRRLAAQDVHATGDATFGTMTYAYDSAGNLSTTTDAKGQAIVVAYDALNRPTSEDYIGLAGTEVTYTYDSCTNGKGYLCTSQNASATTTRAYSPTGLLASEAKTIGTTTYTQSYTYDRQNNQTQIVYPDSSDVKYTYNTAGLLDKIEQRENGGTYRDVITNFDYGPTWQVTYQLHGNGASTTRTYDANELYRLRSIVTTATNPVGGSGELAEIEQEGLMPVDLMLELTDAMSMVQDVFTPTTSATDFVGDMNQVATDTPLILETENTSTSSQNIFVEEATTDSSEGTKVFSGSRVKNADDASTWRRYHNERVQYLKSQKDLPPQALEAAQRGKDAFETRLLKDGYIDSIDGTIQEKEVSIVSYLWNAFHKLFAYLLPEKAYAFVFGKEDFESCGALPCSFSSNTSWGSATASIDSTSKVVGVKSLKAVVTGEGAASLGRTGLSASETWVQFKMYVPNPVVYGASGYFSVLAIGDSGDTARVWLSVEDYGSPRLTIAGDSLSYTDTGINLTQGATNTIEMRLKVNASSGDVDIWKNNTIQGSPNYNGSGSMNTGSFTINKVVGGMEYAPENGISTTYYDDYIIDSAFIGTGTSASNTPPTAPSVLLSEGVTNPTNATDTTPELSAIYQDADAGDIAKHYQIQVSTSSSFTSTYWDTNQTSLASNTPTGSRIADISYSGSTLTSSTTYYWRIKFWDNAGTAGAWSTTTSTFTIATTSASNTPPTAPSALLTEGLTNPTDITDSTPEFSAIFNDPNAGDSANKYRLQVSTTTSFTSFIWDSGTTTMATTTVGNRNPDISYAGSVLASSTSYYWRIAFVDIAGASSTWSTTTSSFTLAAASGGGTSTIALVGTSTNISNGFSGTVTKTWSHTVSGTDPIVILTADIWQDVAGTGAVTSASWNGGALTKASSTRSGSMASEIWYIIATTTGTKTLSVTVTGNTDAIKLGASTFTGVSSTSPLATTGLAAGTSGNPSGTVTSSSIGNLIVATLSRYTTTNATTSRTSLFKDVTGSILGAASYQIGTTTGTLSDTYTGSSANDWSMVLAVFKPSTGTSTGGGGGSSSSTSAIFISLVQHLTYTYDSVGNITQIIDRSGTDSSATTTYVYDDLYRLTSASTTRASTTPYLQTYSYNAIGNLSTKSDIGAYTYAGTGYANSHAPTTVNGVTYSYDQNGNLASTSASVANTWDYRNRLTQAIKGATTTTYAYDTDVQRVSKTSGGVTSKYPSQFFEVTGATSTKHIYMPHGGIAGTVEGTSSSTAKMYFNHLDHLESTGAVTNDIGYTSQVISYYPFGATRISNQYGSFSQSNQFIGQNYDTEDDLNYLNARYYDSKRGQFASQDPMLWKIAPEILLDPQKFNSYSYGGNNPSRYVDRNGEWFQEWNFGRGSQSGPELIIEVGQAANVMYSESTAWRFGMDNPYLPAVVGVAPLAAYSASAVLTALSIEYAGGIGTGCLAFCASVLQRAPSYAERGYRSFDAFKNAVGSADPTGQNLRQWHHIVEQNKTNIANFGQQTLQNGKNIVNIPTGVHQEITAYYNSFSNGVRVRDIVNSLDFQKQTEIGVKVLENVMRRKPPGTGVEF